MNVIPLSVAFHEPCLEILGDIPEDILQPFMSVRVKPRAAVFRDKDQVNM